MDTVANTYDPSNPVKPRQLRTGTPVLTSTLKLYRDRVVEGVLRVRWADNCRCLFRWLLARLRVWSCRNWSCRVRVGPGLVEWVEGVEAVEWVVLVVVVLGRSDVVRRKCWVCWCCKAWRVDAD